MEEVDMSKFLTPRVSRVAAGVAVLCAFAVAPVAAQAATDDATVVVTGAGAVELSVAPTFGNFPGATLNGSNQDVTTTVTDWQVTDATGAAPGWSVNVSADVPHNGGSTILMTGAALALTAPTAVTEGTNASDAPVVTGAPNIIGGGGVNAANAVAGTGAGIWNLVQGVGNLTLTIPADAQAASYTTTITTTLNAAV
jgi:hypothetical protein